MMPGRFLQTLKSRSALLFAVSQLLRQQRTRYESYKVPDKAEKCSGLGRIRRQVNGDCDYHPDGSISPVLFAQPFRRLLEIIQLVTYVIQLLFRRLQFADDKFTPGPWLPCHW